MATVKWEHDEYAANEGRDIRQIRRVLIITMVLNFIAMGVKLSAGWITGALSVIADALDSLFDGLSNIVGLAGLSAAARPPDDSHPYGHRKFETLAALGISFLLFITCYQLIVSTWDRLRNPHTPDVNAWVAAAMVTSMVIQAVTSIYELRQGRKLKSELLIADALHTRASILVSLSVLGGLGLVRLGYPTADPILAFLVALMIAKIGVDVLRETLPILMDQAALDPHLIAHIVEDVGGIESFHRVRSRGAAGNAAVDLHVRVSPNKSIQEANAIADEVRRRLLNQEGITDVTVHVEAQRRPHADATDLFASIRQAANELGLTVHEVWAHRIGSDLYVESHVGVAPDMPIAEAHNLVDHLEEVLRERIPEVKEVHTHIEPATNQVQKGDLPPREVENRIRREVERAVIGIPSLSQPHNIRVRRNPADEEKFFVSLECYVAPQIPVVEAHRLASMLEQELGRRFSQVADVSVHVEPAQSPPG